MRAHTLKGSGRNTMEIPTLHTRKLHPRAWLNRIFAFVYLVAILSLFYHHFLNLINSPNTLITIFLILADLVLTFMWITNQAFRLNPIHRCVFPENLPQVANEKEYPALDVFICTSDPFKEPPIKVVNTALSVLAYSYPVEKLSVYVSDDGASQLTLFAFMEAAKFAKHWLPYCKNNNIVDRSPEVYFASNHASLPETAQIKLLYKRMEERIEEVMEKGCVCSNYISENDQSFGKWANNFTRHDHPPIIEVLLEYSDEEKDVDGKPMPNLIYISREKSKMKPHNFKAGALNALLRVSATMTNAPIFLVVDCDMYSNDPITPLRALCYFLDPYMDSNLAFIQFPQRFHGINENDIYSGEFKLLTQLDTLGYDGLLGPHFEGTGAFFRRHALFGPPSTTFPSEILQDITMMPEIKSIRSSSTDKLKLCHHVAECTYEDNTKWGSEMGFRYGSLVEDMFTSYQLQCQGWKSIFCNPKRAAFLGGSPITLLDLLSQTKRWFIGLLEIIFSKYSPLSFGIRSMNPLQALCYAHYLFWPFWSIPIIIYGFLPQLPLNSSFPIFPKVSDPWFYLYAFLFLGAYGKHLFDFAINGGPIYQRWWNCQRMWLIWGVSGFPFAILEHLLKFLGIATFNFNVTSKVIDDEQSKRYEQGMFEFGVASPMFFTLATAATVNLFSFSRGITVVLMNGKVEELFVQIFIAGFVVVNSWPIYEAMVVRRDGGKMPLKITLTSIALAWLFFFASSLSL